MNQKDRLEIAKGQREYLYDKIEIFKGKSRKEQFLFAMAYGFKNNEKKVLKTKEGFVLIKDLRQEDEALINALAVYDTDSLDILTDKDKVYEIAGQYANAGILMLSDKIDSIQFGSFDNIFEKELRDILNMIR